MDPEIAAIRADVFSSEDLVSAMAAATEAPPADDKATTIINVKSVSVKAWERARAAANREGQSMGQWLSDTIDLHDDVQTGQRENHSANPIVAPVNPALPAHESREVAVTSELLASVARAITALENALADARAERDQLRVERDRARDTVEQVRRAAASFIATVGMPDDLSPTS